MEQESITAEDVVDARTPYTLSTTVEELVRTHPGQWLGFCGGRVAAGADAEECYQKLKVGEGKGATVTYRSPSGKWIVMLWGDGFIAA